MNYDRDYLDCLECQFEHPIDYKCDSCLETLDEDEVIELGDYTLCRKCYEWYDNRAKEIAKEIEDLPILNEMLERKYF